MSNSPLTILDPNDLCADDRDRIAEIASTASKPEDIDFSLLPLQLKNQLLLTIQALAHGKVVASLESGGKPLTTTKAAKALGMSRSHLLRLCDEERIPSHLVGNARRIEADVIIEILKARSEARSQAADAVSTADARRRARAAKEAGL